MQLLAPIELSGTEKLEEALTRFERGLLENSLRRHHGRINETAAALGITRHALRYRMQKLGMDVDQLFAQ